MLKAYITFSTEKADEMAKKLKKDSLSTFKISLIVNLNWLSISKITKLIKKMASGEKPEFIDIDPRTADVCVSDNIDKFW